MKRFEVNGQMFIERKRFKSNQIKDMEGLAEIKHFYRADTIILDKNNDFVILADKVEDAQIIEEIQNE
jgi:hypothetical protein